MGVDGIGKSGPTGGPSAAEPSAAEDVEDVARPGPSESKAPAGSEALARLEHGEIDQATYLDARAAAAVAHLEGRLPADQLDVVRRTIREQLEADPVLVELVRRTTAGASLGPR